MLDRRSFIAGSGALALLGPSLPLLAQGATGVRRSIRGMGNNDPDLAAFRRAVAAMKALPASDPRNWIRFADVHRNFCPHGNWYFLPWHRAYLVALENIVRQLSGKTDFALPYWDWTVQRQIPPAFAAGDRSSNPLNHARPGSIMRTPLPDDMVGGQVMSRILASPDFEAFGSSRPRGQDSAAAQWQRRAGSKTELEFNPHDGVHQAVGGNMAVPQLAARDPLFFLHHANVDRLWSTWNARGNANSAEPVWRRFAFNRNFPDGSSGTWDVSVGELGSTPALGYRYDDDDGPFAADVPLPSGDVTTDTLRAFRRLSPEAFPRAGTGLRRIGVASGGAVHVAVAENAQIAFRERPIGISVPLGRALGDIVDPLAMRPPIQGRRHGPRHVWAMIRDIEPPLDATTRVRTFVGGRELAAAARVNDPSYATSLSFFGGHHAGHHEPMAAATDGGSVSVCVDLSPALAAMSPRDLRSDRITVQLLPLCASSEMQASRVRPGRVEIVIL